MALLPNGSCLRDATEPDQAQEQERSWHYYRTWLRYARGGSRLDVNVNRPVTITICSRHVAKYPIGTPEPGREVWVSRLAETIGQRRSVREVAVLREYQRIIAGGEWLREQHVEGNSCHRINRG